MNILEQKDFNVFVNKSTLYLLNLNNDVIECQNAQEVFEDEQYEKYREHMKSLRRDIFSSPYKNENFNEREHGFQCTIDRLQRLQKKKKLFCRNKDHYLVKKSFTEGIQYVKEGEIHTYTPKGRPLDIFVSENALEDKTFKASYASCTKPRRIFPEETVSIPANTYYAVIAPCHTVFIKNINNTIKTGNSTEMVPSFETGDVYQVTNFTENRNGCPSSTQANGLIKTSPFPLPSGSRDEHGDSRNSFKFEKFDESEMVSENTSTVNKRSSTENDRQAKRAKSSIHEPKPSTSQMEVAVFSPSNSLNQLELMSSHEPRPSTSQREVSFVPPSPNSLRNQLELMSTSGDGCGRVVFAIRKDSGIESYTLSESKFSIHDSIMTGSFTIKNDDMDPNIIEYHGEVQFIREVARFKNGSKFETTLNVQKDLLDELRDTTKRKEKVVVNYFFEYAFKTIEAAYKRFSEMRNTKMIGGCVPAIVPLGDSRFVGVVSDAYEAKP